ncbi:MAG: DNA-binding protein [Coriobacteriia bacterium]
MSLENLVGISLDKIEPSKGTVARLLAAAERNIKDSQVAAVSAENRFDAAYKAIMQLGIVALHANGYRPLTSRPGHHQTAIQTLSQTTGLATNQMIILDGLRKLRNLSDYSGETVPEAAVRECVTQATSLLAHVRAWFAANRPDLIGTGPPESPTT